jgi:serine/threonine protein kinase
MSVTLGALLDSRFELEQAIGGGGMGTVYRARDRFSGEWVAVKLMRTASAGPLEVERFHSEAQVLRSLRHPGIVNYVAHGQTQDGQLYLAMEWLTGEDLCQRLHRGALTIPDCLAVLTQTASALAAAHEHGIVHRDLKPANLFLPSGQVDRLKLLDFGVARHRMRSAGLTGTGVLLGTPEYMAPEQVRGQRDLGPAADIFSLGCVLYECLTGQPPFYGEHIPAVLMRILFEPPVSASARRSGIPKTLLDLLNRMLAKDPGERPQDASALLRELERITSSPSFGDAGHSRDNLAPVRLPLGNEQRLISVLLLESAVGSAIDLVSGETMPSGGNFSAARYQRAADVIAEYAARNDWLMTGELVVTLSGLHDATDLTAKAARCAMALAKIFVGTRVVMATGRGNADNNAPVGEVIDRAAAMLRSENAAESQEYELDQDPAQAIRVDELSARLLERRFSIIRRSDGYRLLGEHTGDEARPLLGKPTSCVGRESELGILDSLWNGCLEDDTARAVLVTAAPGVGKSRLRQEFLRRLRGKNRPFTLLEGRAELMSSSSTYDVVARAVRRLCEINGLEPPAEQRQKIQARVALHVSGAAALRIAVFLGELCGVPFPEAADPVLSAARQDPESMRGQLQANFLQFLRAEASAAPVVIVLDDLQWADALSVRLLDYVLQFGGDIPLLLIMLARPQVIEQYAAFWQKRQITQIVLKELNRKACERLIRQVLGVQVDNAVVQRLWERSAGHALFLEESLRAFAEGISGDRADTVVAMLQARLGRLSAAARRVVRAASVFGDTFWRGGVAAVLDELSDEKEISQGLQELLAAEFIDKHPESRLANEEQYGFRHALLREAAYGLLIAEDLGASHRSAGTFLSSAGEADPLLIAEHLEKGNVPAEAIYFFIQASELSLRRGDLSGALELTGRADRCGATHELLGQVRGLQAHVYACTLDRDAQARAAHEAMTLLRPGSQRWCKAAQNVLGAESARGNPQAVRDLSGSLFDVLPEGDASPDFQWLLSMALWSLCSQGDFALSRRIYEFAGSLQQLLGSTWVQSRIRLSQSQYLRFADPDPFHQVEWLKEAYSNSIASEALDYIVIAADFLGESLGELGELAEAEATLRSSLERARHAKHEYLTIHAQLHLCELLAHSLVRTQLEEALEIAAVVLAAPKLSVGYREWAHALQARAWLSLDDHPSAESALRQAMSLPALSQFRRLLIEAMLLDCLLARRDLLEAEQVLAACRSKLGVLGSAGYAEIPVRVSVAAALWDLGRPDQAKSELRIAQTELMRRANKIPDAALRERFLTQVPANARLAREFARRCQAASA